MQSFSTLLIFITCFNILRLVRLFFLKMFRIKWSTDIGGQKSHEIQQQLDKLNEVRETLAKIIAEKTGKRLKEIYKVTATDTCFSAEEAVAFGLATEILTEV